ncbi:MAG: hypothetical protein ACKVIQ_03485 [Acidimicrobiales bacterium]
MTEQPNHEMDDMAEVAAAVRRLSEALIIRQLDGDMAQATIDALVGIAERVEQEPATSDFVTASLRSSRPVHGLILRRTGQSLSLMLHHRLVGV